MLCRAPFHGIGTNLEERLSYNGELPELNSDIGSSSLALACFMVLYSFDAATQRHRSNKCHWSHHPCLPMLPTGHDQPARCHCLFLSDWLAVCHRSTASDLRYLHQTRSQHASPPR